MVGEFTLLSTLAVHHLIIGACMILLMLLVNRLHAVSVELKSWLWMTVFISATLLPLSQLMTGENETSITVEQKIVISDDMEISRNAPANPTPLVSEQGRIWHMPMEWVYFYGPLIYAFLAIWLAGSLWRASYLLRRLRFTRQIKQHALKTPLHLEHPQLKRMTICRSERIQSPMVIGILSPCIILPEHMVDSLSDETLLPVLLHEQAHIKRFDVAFCLLQEVIAIVFWWSPVIRIINHNLHISRELACDIRAAQSGKGNKAYAQSLLECARLMVKQKQNILAMSLFSKKKELHYRIESVINNTTSQAPNIAYSFIVCIAIYLLTAKTAQSFTPKISVDQVNQNAKHYSILTDSIGRALIEAVINQDIDTITMMSNNGVDLDTPARRDGTALMIAVKRNDMDMVNALLDLGANPDQSSMGDGNPLIIAAQRNNLQAAQLLIDRGADVNKVVPRDETPLINATGRGDLGMTRLLVENGADVNQRVRTGYSDGYELRSPMNMARTQAIRDYLISQGAQADP